MNKKSTWDKTDYYNFFQNQPKMGQLSLVYYWGILDITLTQSFYFFCKKDVLKIIQSRGSVFGYCSFIFILIFKMIHSTFLGSGYTQRLAIGD